MHIGNLRTALYTYLLAKHEGGTFILRIEDTDQNRYVEGALDAIFRSLDDCGIIFDEGPGKDGGFGPYVQSERRALYKEYAEKLIELGGAYRDDEAIRQRIPREGETKFTDAVFGEITVPNESASLDEGVLLKSDGLPTYNFANVIDDHLMGITHVVRGSEYLPSTPKYTLLYEAFGWEPPLYIHVSPVMRDATHKLSKRAGDPTYEDLTAQGYLPEAILNYVALVGWSPGGEREFYTLRELTEAFTISGISKSPALFDIVKLNYFNAHYIRELPPEDFAARIASQLPAEYDANAIAALLQSRTEKLTDAKELAAFFEAVPEYSLELYRNKKAKTTPEAALQILVKLSTLLQSLTDWTDEALFTLLSEAEDGFTKNARLWVLRIAISGLAVTPGGATAIAAILGKAETLSRITSAIGRLQNGV
jgi:glutamyl-tRNA synthetase